MKKMDEKTDHAELQRACRNLTGSNDGPMQWLLEFAQESDEALSPEKRRIRRYEARALIFLGKGATLSRPETIHDQARTIGDKEVQAIRPHIRSILTEVAMGNRLEFPLGLFHDQARTSGDKVEHPGLRIIKLEIVPYSSLETHPYNPKKNRMTTEGRVVPVVESVADLFAWNLIHLIASYFGRVRQCPECEKLFLQNRRDQEYCSRACQSRRATRSFLGIPHDRRGKIGRPPISSSEKKPTPKKGKKA